MAEVETPELDTDIVKRVFVAADGTELDIQTPWVERDVQITKRMRIPLYVNGVIKNTEELAALGLTVREYTRLEVEQAYYRDLYARDAAGDGALAERVRQYKGILDTLCLAYDSTQDAVMAAIQAAEMEDKDKAALALTMKTVYDAITTILEFYGSDSPHMDTYTMLAKLIKYLPEVAAEGGE